MSAPNYEYMNMYGSKRAKLEEIIAEELRKPRPASHSSHFEPPDEKPPKKPQDKRLTELLAENMHEQLTLNGITVGSGASTSASTDASTSTYTGAGAGAGAAQQQQQQQHQQHQQSIIIPKSIEIPPMEGDLPQLSLHSSFFVEGVKIGWPFPVVMPPQRQMALHLIKALKKEKHVVLESPTGTGKSAAILCAVLAWHRYHLKRNTDSSDQPLPKIIYCSRTHSQVAQMISSLRKTPYRPRMAILGSRQHLCIHKQVLADGKNINTECRVRVRNTDEMRKRMFTNANEFYDDQEPPMSMPQDELESATKTFETDTDANANDNANDNNDTGARTSKACCGHYRQLGPKRTAQLAHACFVPSCASNKKGGALTKQGTHDVEDLVKFGNDPYRKRSVAVYREDKQPFGMTVVEQEGRIHVAQVHARSPASQTSLKIGDELMQINGQPVEAHSSVDDIARRIGATPLGEPLLVDATSDSNLSVRNDDDEDTSSPHAPCPYYLARALAKNAELVFCPYNYVLDPSIRSSLGLELDNAVVVLDEAHNVEDVLRDAGSGKFGEFEMAEIIIMLQFYATDLKTNNGASEEKKDLTECAHELLVLMETLMYFLMDSKLAFERTKSAKIVEDWAKFKTPDETEFDMTFDGPNGHGVRGKAVGCATFFDKVTEKKLDVKALKINVEAMEAHIRSKQDFARDKYSSSLDKLAELITMLSYAYEHTEHYYIATVAKANGNLEFASGQMMASSSTNRFQRKPQRLPIIPPRKGNDTATLRSLPDVCLHPHCRAIKCGPNFISGHVRHGDYCNGSQPPWEAHLVIELLTPSRFFADLRTKCRTIVLASGSLAPIPSLCAELGLEGQSAANATAKPALVAGKKVPFGNLARPPPAASKKRPIDKVKSESALGGDTKEVNVPEVPRLQIQPKPLEANHVIDLEKQLLAVSCGYFTDGSPLTVNYSNWSKGNFLEKLGDAIATVIEAIPTGGVLIFLPSYSFLRKCIAKWKPTNNSVPNWGGWGNTGQEDSPIWDRLTASKGKIIVEPTGSQSKFEMARDEYATTIKETGRCILFAVFRGKMSEGISFNDDNARGVICVGIPYPNAFDRSIKAKKNYNDEQRKIHRRKDVLPGNEWYSQQAYRAIAQALGRCIRHAADYGTVVLMDSRHCDDGGPRDGDLCRAHQKLPKWMRYNVKNLSKSSHDMGYGGDKSIPGGWSGLQREMNRFFAEAPSHAKLVLDKQTDQLLKSQAQSSKHQFNVKTGRWTPSGKSNALEDAWGKQKVEQQAQRLFQHPNHVTPQSPMMYDLASPAASITSSSNDVIGKMSVKELKAAIHKAGLDHQARGLIEKQEFVKLLRDHQAKGK
jgi:Rad3-related DNA helicase